MTKPNLKLKLKQINHNQSKKYLYYNYFSNFKDRVTNKFIFKNNKTIMKIKITKILIK